jgi:hypothetical protein
VKQDSPLICTQRLDSHHLPPPGWQRTVIFLLAPLRMPSLQKFSASLEDRLRGSYKTGVGVGQEGGVGVTLFFRLQFRPETMADKDLVWSQGVTDSAA